MRKKKNLTIDKYRWTQINETTEDTEHTENKFSNYSIVPSVILFLLPRWSKDPTLGGERKIFS
jgi:hypothetical protein